MAKPVSKGKTPHTDPSFDQKGLEVTTTIPADQPRFSYGITDEPNRFGQKKVNASKAHLNND